MLQRSEDRETGKPKHDILVADKENWVPEGATEEYLVRSTMHHTHLRRWEPIVYLKA